MLSVELVYFYRDKIGQGKENWEWVGGEREGWNKGFQKVVLEGLSNKADI